MNEITYKDFSELSEDEKRDIYGHFLRSKQSERDRCTRELQKLLKQYYEINFVIHDVSDLYTTISVILSYPVGYDGETEISNLTEEIAGAMGYEMCDTKNGQLTAKCKVKSNCDVHTLMSIIANDLYMVLFNKPDHSFNYSKV